MEKDRKLTLEQVLGQQIIDILHTNNIGNIKLEDDGTISGIHQTVRGLPTTEYVRDIRIIVQANKIVITGKVTHSDIDVGKII